MSPDEYEEKLAETIRFYANAIAEIEIGRRNAERERDEALRYLAKLQGWSDQPKQRGKK